MSIVGMILLIGTMLSITVGAYNEYHSGIGTVDRTVTSRYATVGGMKNYTYTSTKYSDHYSSYKYAACKSYRYVNGSYVPNDINHATGTSRAIVTDSLIVNGSVGRVLFKGDVYHTSDITSGILSSVTIVVYRAGLPTIRDVY